MSVNFPIEVPFTDTRSTRPVETDSVPVPGDDGPDDGLAAGVVGLVLAGASVLAYVLGRENVPERTAEVEAA